MNWLLIQSNSSWSFEDIHDPLWVLVNCWISTQLKIVNQVGEEKIQNAILHQWYERCPRKRMTLDLCRDCITFYPVCLHLHKSFLLFFPHNMPSMVPEMSKSLPKLNMCITNLHSRTIYCFTSSFYFLLLRTVIIWWC